MWILANSAQMQPRGWCMWHGLCVKSSPALSSTTSPTASHEGFGLSSDPIGVQKTVMTRSAKKSACFLLQPRDHTSLPCACQLVTGGAVQKVARHVETSQLPGSLRKQAASRDTCRNITGDQETLRLRKGMQYLCQPICVTEGAVTQIERVHRHETVGKIP